MKKTLCTLGMASLLLTGVAATGFTAGTGADDSQKFTETQTGSQQVGRPAAGARTPTGSYGMTSNNGGTMTYPGTATGSAQSSPDATHPTAPSPSGGGDAGAGSGSGGTSR
jgi:hypothetical protein